MLIKALFYNKKIKNIKIKKYALNNKNLLTFYTWKIHIKFI